MADSIERRRTPRVDVPDGEICRLELRHRVQLLDISQSGALLRCDAGLPLGTRGQLRAGLAALPFVAEVTVRRLQAPPAGKKQMGMGTQFAAMDDRSRNSLDQFLRRGKD